MNRNLIAVMAVACVALIGVAMVGGSEAWIGLGAMLVGVGLALVVRLAVRRAALARRDRQPPPERELIADAKRPTLLIGLLVLVVAIFGLLAAGLTGNLGPTGGAPATPAPAAEPIARTVSPLAGLGLPAAGLVLGLAALAGVWIVARRRKPAAGSDSSRVDWQDVLGAEDGEEGDMGEDSGDLSFWVDRLKKK